ncbi:MAG: peroxiredoxin family protein [Thermodesulfovibrionales bacterium]
MKKSRAFSRGLIRIAFITFMVFLVLSSCTRGKKQAIKGDEAPDFTLRTTNSSEVHLSDLRGKVVLIEFWATWCPPCRESIPTMNEIYKRYNEKGLVLLGISVDKGQNVVEDLRAFVREYSIQYPVLIDSKNVNNLYGVYSIPTTFLIDKEGKIVFKSIGFSPEVENKLSAEIERLL